MRAQQMNRSKLDSPKMTPPKRGSDLVVWGPGSTDASALTLRIRPGAVLRLFVLLTATLVTVHLGFMVLRYGFGHDTVFGIAKFFDLWPETTIPAWYSSVTLSLCGVGLLVIAWATRRSGQSGTLYWLGLALLFLFVSLDEAIALHERLMKPVREMFGLSGALLFAWVVPYGMAILALAAIYFRFLSNLPKPTRRQFLLAAAVFLGGAMGVEMIGGVVYEAGNFERAVPIEICNGVEEALEMLGVAIFLYALTDHLGREFPGLRLAFGESRPDQRALRDGTR